MRLPFTPKHDRRQEAAARDNHVEDWFFRSFLRRGKCSRCGGPSGRITPANGYFITTAALCQTCWDEMSPERRCQWFATNIAAWWSSAARHPASPHACVNDPGHFQFNYRDLTSEMEAVRRAAYGEPRNR